MQVLLGLIGIVMVAVVCISVYDNTRFKSVYYQFGDTKDSQRKTDENVKIVFLTDLHSRMYGKNNEKLINAVKREKPDLILIGGDMFVKNEHPDMRVALQLVTDIVKIAPVYYANGNHEKKVMVNWESSKEPFEDYVKELKALGVHYLMGETEKVICKGRTFEIIGLDLDLYYYLKYWKKPELTLDKLTKRYLVPKRTGKEDCRILLAHNPKYFTIYAQADVDYVLSGHVHGGLARLPKLGGVIAPDLTLFPKYDSGTFVSGDTTMVVSRGLGAHTLPIRIFNIPELSVIEL